MGELGVFLAAAIKKSQSTDKDRIRQVFCGTNLTPKDFKEMMQEGGQEHTETSEADARANWGKLAGSGVF